ncbi:hypothetical protein RJ640_018508 [Escallonia rubra]|uniref:J domain-containing protein n=1 Tax=Escallonia rubra TaxID=112253 RepID=A0AA88R676_9ASTE|nr:hypothetical protein RJ640_018508 [Escallonia rubra]
MEPPYSTARAEALRWLGIAEKLLATRDLVGSKTFAIRARESDPTLEPADQILAVVDTLLASDKRINGQQDFYAVLQLFRCSHDPELIAAQHRRLALLLNPHRNRLPFADHAFRLVSEAWSVLSNPSRKSVYDNQIDFAPNRVPEQQNHQNRHPQRQQQPPQPAPRVSPRKTVNDITVDESQANSSTIDEASTFWTACPYCYHMYQYPRVYVECTLRCQKCERAFQAVALPSPPPVADGKEAYFCCWGFYPIGVSAAYLEKSKGGVSNWSPFSPMITCPPQVGEEKGKMGGKNANVGAPKAPYVRKTPAPRVYIDDDPDVNVDLSDQSEDSDVEWGTTRRKKKKKKVKRGKTKGSAVKSVKQQQAEKAKNVKGGGGANLQAEFAAQDGMVTSSAPVAETSKRVVGSGARRQSGRAAKELGKLDLNVEFSNEVEEPAPGTSEGNGAGNGVEENIEGIGFFEGLDEFLSSLPILSVVGDDKAKAA